MTPELNVVYCECSESIERKDSGALLAFIREHEARGHCMMVPWWKKPYDGYAFMSKQVGKDALEKL